MSRRTDWCGRAGLHLSAAVLAVIMGGCGGGGGSSPRGTPGTVVGQTIPMGNGEARSFLTVGNDGRPTAVGVAMTEAALTGLPSATKTLFELNFPATAPGTVFDHIELRYWARGHDPQELFAVEHIDFIPFLISQQQRDAITATGNDIGRVLRVPSAKQIPPGYAPIPSVDEFFAEPRYGTRYFDVPSFTPVLDGTAAYTTTLFYGYYDGQIDFLEIPITLNFLKAQSDLTLPIPVPETLPENGYYPSRYRIRHDTANQEFTFTMEGLVHK